MMLKYFLLWFPMIFIAIINGTARDLWYEEYIDDLAARQLSTISLIIFLGIYIFIIVKKYPPKSSLQSWLIGIFWMLLTLIFEFGFGIYRGNTWLLLLDDYDIAKGHIWILIPLWLILAPYISYKLNKS